MRRLLLISFFIVIIPGAGLLSQSYYYNINYGVSKDYPLYPKNSRTILNMPANDTFSTVQNLPFDWYFYGEKVTQYKASDNGFITFDVDGTDNTGDNGVIPKAEGPNNSIYAFWDDLELVNNPSYSNNNIKTYTLGTAPNRVHVIQWHATPRGQMGNSYYLFFAIRLYEGGDFDIMYQQIRLATGSMSGTAGCENGDGSDGTMINGSPVFTYEGGTFIPENCLVYSFHYGTRPLNDVSFNSIGLPEVADINEEVSIKGSIINHGAKDINLLRIVYHVDGGEDISADLDGLDIKTNESFDFTHPVKWKPDKPGEFQKVECSISKINKGDDNNKDDNELSYDVFVNYGYTAHRKTLIEEFSTAQCGFCPEGHLFLEEALESSSDICGFTHHSGFGVDSMTIGVSKKIAAEFTTGAPTAAVDRTKWPGEIYHAVGRYNNIMEKKNNWAMKANECLGHHAPLGLNLNASLDIEKRELTVDADIDVIDYIKPGDIRLNVFVIEDHVTGEGSGYDQKNYYNETAGHPLFGMGNPIAGYDHRRVIRASLTGDWGEPGVLESKPAPEQQSARTYTWKIPGFVKMNDLSIIAFVSYYDGEKKRDILNTEEIENLPLGISDLNGNIARAVNIFPNPAADVTNIRYLHRGGFLSVNLYDPVSGACREIAEGLFPEGEKIFRLGCASLSQGFYIVQVKTNYGNAEGKLVILR